MSEVLLFALLSTHIVASLVVGRWQMQERRRLINMLQAKTPQEFLMLEKVPQKAKRKSEVITPIGL